MNILKDVIIWILFAFIKTYSNAKYSLLIDTTKEYNERKSIVRSEYNWAIQSNDLNARNDKDPITMWYVNTLKVH